MSSMRWSQRLPRTAQRALSTRGPPGPRSILDKSRSSRLPAHPSKPIPKSPQHGRDRSSQQSNQQPDHGISQQPQDEQQPSRTELVSTALAENQSSDLVAPVQIPDDPNGILSMDHPTMSILNNSSLVIQRQLEMMNVFLGYEQANKYIIMNGRGETIGYLAEEDHGIGQALARQAFKTHRSFTAHIFDREEREVLRIHRPFAWINSRIRIYDPSSSSSSESSHAPTTSLQGTSASSALGQSAAQTSTLPLSSMRIIGEAQQQWAPLRRKYNLFTYRPLTPPQDSPSTPKLTSGDKPNTETKALVEAETRPEEIEAGMSQFAHINEPFLSWDFGLKDAEDRTLGSVNRNFGGFAREIFTDTGVYALRMDSASLASPEQQPAQGDGEVVEGWGRETALTLDQRAVMLATAVSIDFDYFSRHSGAGAGGFMPLWFPGMGGAGAEGGAVGGAAGGAAGAEAGAAGAGAAGEVGAAEGAGAVGNAARGTVGAGEGAMAGAGTMAGYEAMQRGAYGNRDAQQGADDASPTNNEPFGAGQYGDGQGDQPGQPGQQPPEEEVWGEGNDWWGGGRGDGDGGQSGGGDGDGGQSGGGDEGGGGFSWTDFFGGDE